MNTNKIKEQICSGKAVAGVVMADNSLTTLELLALSGFDFIFIDCEHGPMTVESVSLMVMAAEYRGVTTLVRAPANEEEKIMRYMDTGAGGIIIPGVDSVETAKAAVQAVKYQPLGRRGLAGVRAADFGLTRPLSEYISVANQTTMVFGVVESMKGVENITDILEVDGFDGVFMGTNDLSNSLGMTGQTSHPDVLKAVDRILSAGRETGKCIGGVVRAGETPQQYIDKGCSMVLTASQALLAEAAKNFLKQITNRSI